MKKGKKGTAAEEFDWYSIEPDLNCYGGRDGFAVYGHGTYGPESVLEGRPKRAYLNSYDSVEAARKDYPTAEETGCTKEFNPSGSLADASGLPKCPPSWFDPADAGESWDEE